MHKKMQNNQRLTSDWHSLQCSQVQKENPTCRCAEPVHHVGAFHVAVFLGLVTQWSPSR